MTITTNSRSNHSEAYTLATSGVMINRVHNLPVTEQDKEKFETQSKSNIAQGNGHTQGIRKIEVGYTEKESHKRQDESNRSST